MILPAAPVSVRGTDGRVRSTARLALPASVRFDWRSDVFETYLGLANAAGPACDAVGLRWWVF